MAHPPVPGAPRPRAASRAGARLAAALGMGIGLWGAPAAHAGDGPGAAPRPTPADEAPAQGPADWLAALDAPFQADRDAAVARLTSTLPASREAVLAAFREGTPPRRTLLARVLASDDGKESEEALFDGLAKASDLQERRAMRAALITRGPQALKAAKAFLASRQVPPAARAEFTALERLAERDRVETMLLAKKSKSGATGFYKGQFEDLRPYRPLALEVLSHVVMNRPLREPGVFPAGTYRFLRRPPFFVEGYELRDIAANGLSELAPADPGDAKSVDDATMLVLLGMARDLKNEALLEERRKLAAVRRNPRMWRPLPSEADELLNVVLVTLALARPDSEAPQAVEDRIELYVRKFRSPDSAAMLRMRMEQYEAAIEYYEAIAQDGNNIVLPKYNVACAYAKWSESSLKDKDPRKAAEYRRKAMESLRWSVESGYADWPWMEEDRDIDAIRKEPDYARLLAKMKDDFSPESVRKTLGRPPPAKVPAPPAMGDALPPPAMGEPPGPPPAPPPPAMDGR